METTQPSKFARRQIGYVLWKTLKVLILILMIGGFLLLGRVSYLFFKIAADAPPLDLTKIHAANSSIIYDRDGNVISEFGAEKREWVSYDEISPVLIDAFLATEDSNFFNHPGVDFKRLLVAVITNLLTDDDQGASTITQQLIKQTHLTPDKNVTRKIQEIYLALQIEKELTKEQILEAYLNYSTFGGGIYGVEKAAQYYFGTSASDLTLSQAAVLAGLVQRPEAYRPDYYPDDAEYRRDIVLQLMVRHGYITEELAEAAKAQPITDLLACDIFEIDDREKYQSFIDQVLREVETKYGLDPRDGLQIYTTMDPEAQVLAYDLQHPTLSQTYNIQWPNDMKSGIIFMDTQTGEIRAIGGGYSDDATERGFNFATQLKRQPGSTAKPIFAYGPAIEYLKWGTGTMVNDELYTYQDGSEKIIHNYNHVYGGRMTIRNALNKSLNIPAVKALNAVGLEKVQEFAEKLGFVFDEPIYEPAAIGGFATGFSPLDMAGAYAAFGNGGVYNEPITITKVVKSDGSVVESKQDSRRAMSEETAYLMTDMLHTVMTEGTGTVANVSGMYLSGKTGTTNFAEKERQKLNLPSNAIRDSWFVGYSSEYTAAIWTGYKDNTSGQYINSQTQSMPWHLFNRLMENLNTAGSEDPKRPSSIQSCTIELESGEEDGQVFSPSEYTPQNYIEEELFIKGYGPSDTSTRFSQLETPQNFKGVEKDGKLLFTWDHIKGYTLEEEDLNNQIKEAQDYATEASYLEDMPTLNPTESQLRMMLKQVQTIGQTFYDVYGVDYNGVEHLLGTTTEQELTIEGLTFAEISQFEFYYLEARYEKITTLNSEPTEFIKIDCEFCSKPIEIPNMKGWTKKQVEDWAKEQGILVEFKTESSTEVETDTVLSTDPAEGRLFPQDNFLVVLAKKDLIIPDYRTYENFLSRYDVWANDHGLVFKTEDIYHPDVPAGGLIQVLPDIGQSIDLKETITLVISKGPEPVIENPIPPISDENSSEEEDPGNDLY